MTYDAAKIVTSLPTQYRSTMTVSGESVSVARTSLSSDLVVDLYGAGGLYAGSVFVADSALTAAGVTLAEDDTVVLDGETMLVIGQRHYAGDIRRVDLAPTYDEA